MSIGERISELRKKQNISQGKLAEFLGISRQAVSKWETDQSSPDTLNLIRLADLLDTDVEFLATGRHSSVQSPPVIEKTVEIVEKIVEKPVIQIVEKVVDRPVIQYVEKPVVQFVEKPVVKKVYRTRYMRNPLEYAIVGAVFFLVGILMGILLF